MVSTKLFVTLSLLGVSLAAAIPVGAHEKRYLIRYEGDEETADVVERAAWATKRDAAEMDKRYLIRYEGDDEKAGVVERAAWATKRDEPLLAAWATKRDEPVLAAWAAKRDAAELDKRYLIRYEGDEEKADDGEEKADIVERAAWAT